MVAEKINDVGFGPRGDALLCGDSNRNVLCKSTPIVLFNHNTKERNDMDDKDL
jgi:hypothetical protein